MTGIINNKTKNKYKSLWNNLFFEKELFIYQLSLNIL